MGSLCIFVRFVVWKSFGSLFGCGKVNVCVTTSTTVSGIVSPEALLCWLEDISFSSIARPAFAGLGTGSAGAEDGSAVANQLRVGVVVGVRADDEDDPTAIDVGAVRDRPPLLIRWRVTVAIVVGVASASGTWARYVAAASHAARTATAIWSFDIVPEHYDAQSVAVDAMTAGRCKASHAARRSCTSAASEGAKAAGTAAGAVIAGGRRQQCRQAFNIYLLACIWPNVSIVKHFKHSAWDTMVPGSYFPTLTIFYTLQTFVRAVTLCSHRVHTAFTPRSHSAHTVFTPRSHRVHTALTPCSHRVHTAFGPRSHRLSHRVHGVAVRNAV